MKSLYVSGYVLTLTWLLCQPLSGQPGIIDSLLRVLQSGKEDTHQVNTMAQLGRAYQQAGNMAELWNTADSMHRLSQQIRFPKGIATGLHQKGIYYYYTSQFPQALEAYQEGLRISEAAGLRRGMANSYNNMGLVYNELANYPEALKNYTASLDIYKELRDTSGMSRCYNNIGILHDNQGRYPEALESYYKALAISEKKNDKAGQANVYLNIGLIHHNQKNYTQALKEFEIALKLAQEVNYPQVIAGAYGNMANSYHKLKDEEQALNYNAKAIEISEELGNTQHVAMAHNTAGNINSALKKYDQALIEYRKAMRSFDEMGDSLHLGITVYNIGNMYYLQGKYHQAIDYLCQSMDIASRIGSNDELLNSYAGLANSYAAVGDYRNAYTYQVAFTGFRDSVFNETKSQQIADIRLKYEAEKKDAEIELLNTNMALQDSEIKKQKVLKYAFIGGLAGVLLLSLVVVSNIRVRNKLRLQSLRNKIARDLHDDVGSTLSSIAIFSDIAQQQSREVIPMLNTIGESARKMLDAMGDIVWTIHPENDDFERIIMRMRNFAFDLLGARSIEFTFDADTQVAKRKLPMDVRKNLYLIFKEATNNLVKYSEANKASIALREEQDHLVLLVRDNGRGFKMDTVSGGSGLRNMKQRAQEIGANLRIESGEGLGTSVHLSIPV